MDNLKKFKAAFVEVFGLDESKVNENLSKETVDNWDSVHQLGLVTHFEDTFDIMLDPEDIMELTSYNAAKEILAKYEIQL